ncbi:hypothetical protein [Sporolactobacillus nakayamae]|uniref:SWIM-type domain-containing protein n=1 Tax=Sporolactobacillus nakayamae TaxID=269670 RepID=A0A1I2SU61_9BACL|nr:hypothetical protein [Sporolactobacillus nakayamae]SFG53706.1 hypothetical protein SAMN02982927_01998 [Sporolactobacillus nakayamae]
MVRRLIFRNVRLANWLADYAAKTEQNTFERGIMLFDKHRVWDYHASEQGLHASVEDLHSTFFQVHIRWFKETDDISANHLPPNLDQIDAVCGCHSKAPFCEHITASIIYWIMRLDKSKGVGKTESAADQGDSPAYQALAARLKTIAASETPSYQRFDTSKLSICPAIQDSAEQIVKTVMAYVKNRAQ